LHLVIGGLSSVRVSLDERLRGGILLLKGSSMCMMITLYVRMSYISQSRGCDGEKNEGELHGNVELVGVRVE
jgi:hypothetical protein